MGPPPALPAPAPARASALPAGAVIEVDLAAEANGNADLAGRKVKIGAELARARVTLRLDGHLLHVIAGGVLAKTLPSPVPADGRTALRGARIAGTPLPSPVPGAVSVQRKVSRDGVIMVTRQRLRVGATYAQCSTASRDPRNANSERSAIALPAPAGKANRDHYAHRRTCACHDRSVRFDGR